MPYMSRTQWRRGTAAQWTSVNPVLAAGEPGFETDTLKFKVGNGTATWTALSYQGGSGGTTDAEIVRDTIAGALTAGAGITVTPNDAGDTITVSADLSSVAAKQLTKRSFSANYTLVLGDASDIILHSTASSDITVTLPTTASVAIGQEVAIPWRQNGTGRITFVGASGVTVNSPGAGSTPRSKARYAQGTITKSGTDAWVVDGYIEAP